MDLLRPLLDALLPHTCLLCGATNPDSNICAPCHADLPWLENACTVCALPLPPPAPPLGAVCGRCLRQPPSFDSCLAVFRYASPVDRLISQFKNHNGLKAGALLRSCLLEKLSARWEENDPPDLITTVPLHWHRQLQRGFNQAAFLAESLSCRFRIPLGNVARRALATPKQQQLNRRQRLGNLREAFEVSATTVAEKHIALVDDVLTTGATAEALSRALKKAGARRVQVWALARTPAPADR